MAAIGSIFLELGLNSAGFEKGISAAEANIKKTSQNLAHGVDQVSSKALGQVAGIARMVAAPLAGAISIGAMIKSYFGGVAQVAQMTGAYSPKLEEWRKKRAMLNRVTREDILLYKKSREAIVKFQITMADLSAKIMRKASPAVKSFVDMLNKVSDWVDKYSNDIVRFLQIVAAIITTAMLPALMKMAVALMMNPLTWIIAALIGLALVIDDLVVWLENGNSALDSFWSQFGNRAEVLAAIKTAIKNVTETLENLWTSLKTGVKDAVNSFSDFWTSSNNTQKVINSLKNAWASLKSIVLGFIDIWNALVLSISQTDFLADLGRAFNGAFNTILGLFNFFLAGIETIIGLVKGVLTGDWVDFTSGFERSIKSAGQMLSGFYDFVVGTIGALLDIVFAIFGKATNNISKLISSTWDDIAGWISQKFDSINQAWQSVCNNIASFFKDKIDKIKASWSDFWNSIKGWIDRAISWFADIGKAIAKAFSFDNIMKKADAVLNKLNPKNWFSSDDDKKNGDNNTSSVGASAGSENKGNSDGWLSSLFKSKDNLKDINNTSSVGASAEMSNISTNNTNRTVNNNQQINMYQPDASAVDRVFDRTGASSDNQYADMIDQGVVSMS